MRCADSKAVSWQLLGLREDELNERLPSRQEPDGVGPPRGVEKKTATAFTARSTSLAWRNCETGICKKLLPTHRHAYNNCYSNHNDNNRTPDFGVVRMMDFLLLGVGQSCVAHTTMQRNGKTQDDENLLHPDSLQPPWPLPQVDFVVSRGGLPLLDATRWPGSQVTQVFVMRRLLGWER